MQITCLIFVGTVTQFPLLFMKMRFYNLGSTGSLSAGADKTNEGKFEDRDAHRRSLVRWKKPTKPVKQNDGQKKHVPHKNEAPKRTQRLTSLTGLKCGLQLG